MTSITSPPSCGWAKLPLNGSKTDAAGTPSPFRCGLNLPLQTPPRPTKKSLARSVDTTKILAATATEADANQLSFAHWLLPEVMAASASTEKGIQTPMFSYVLVPDEERKPRGLDELVHNAPRFPDMLSPMMGRCPALAIKKRPSKRPRGDNDLPTGPFGSVAAAVAKMPPPESVQADGKVAPKLKMTTKAPIELTKCSEATIPQEVAATILLPDIPESDDTNRTRPVTHRRRLKMRRSTATNDVV